MSIIIFFIALVVIILALVLGSYLFGLVFYWSSNLLFLPLAYVMVKEGYGWAAFWLVVCSALTWAHTIKRIQKNKAMNESEKK